ncbi:MAG: hypothetical protein M1818_002608 [Claussenomyces sp. TS43310]|nr:MAG: hypothetical protein M1818_002608 [Claussenomyces sp. TS43310]
MAIAEEDIEQVGTTQTRESISEHSPLLQSQRTHSVDRENSEVSSIDLPSEEPRNAAGVISILMIGVFIANADSSLVLATGGTISSQFSQLGGMSWLTTSYAMAMCTAQPVIGKLSDIFGRKAVILVCYAFFALGSGLCGMGQTMWQVIVGRAVAGIGGAGVTVIVSILVTDLVPMIEVAAWRSYVNVVATTGRSLGAPIGGLFADTVGWRWSFFGQVPLMALAFALLAFRLAEPTTGQSGKSAKKTPYGSRIGRVDFVGAILISGTIISLLFAVDTAGVSSSWRSPLLVALLCGFASLAAAFILWEAKFAREPIFPPVLLLQRDVITTYLIVGLQIAAQLALMFSVPLYFQVVSGASNTSAGTHLIPAVLGNAIGALLAGVYIKRSGQYKSITMGGIALAAVFYLVLIFRWHGHITVWESLEILPAGFGTGVTMTTTFIALTSRMPHEKMAVATSGLYLSSNLGMVLGVSISSSIQKFALKIMLEDRIQGPNAGQIIENVLSEVSYIRHLRGSLRDLIIKAYVESLTYSHVKEPAMPVLQTLKKHHGAFFTSAAVNVGAVLFGFDTGVAGGIVALASFKSDFQLADPKNANKLAHSSSNIVALLNAGAFFGAIAPSLLTKWIGRRHMLTIAGVFFLIGGILQTAANYPSLSMIYGGRVLAGFGVGIISNTAPVFVAECAPKELRGIMMSVFEMFLVSGGMLAYWTVYGCSRNLKATPKQWRIPLSLQVILAGIVLISSLFLPESPRYLAQQGKWDQCAKSLSYLRGASPRDPGIIEEMAEIKTQIEEEAAITKGRTIKELFIHGNIQRLGWGMGVAFFAMWCGHNAILYYGPTVFAEIGFKGQNASLLASGVFTCLKFGCTILFILSGVHIFRRKTMFVVGAFFMGACLFALGAVLATYPPSSKGNGSSSPSGKGMWVYMGEIFPMRVRDYGMACCAMIIWSMNYVVSKIAPTVILHIGWKTWMVFGSTNIAGMIFAFFLPETKGVGLEDMDVLFGMVDESKRAHDLERNMAGEIVKTKNGTRALAVDLVQNAALDASTDGHKYIHM